MLNFNQLLEIKRVKDSSPFTKTQSVSQYIAGVRKRMAKWYGVPESSVSLNRIHDYLINGRI